MRTLVFSKEEIEKNRPYKENYNLSIFPKHYPAFVNFINHDGGLCGDYYTMEILEIPKKYHSSELACRAFADGVNHKAAIYSESIFVKK